MAFVVSRKPPSPLALRRIALGLDQTDVAALTDLAAVTISRLENGHHRPTRVTQRALAAALECEIGDIFPDNESSHPGKGGSTTTTDAGGQSADYPPR